MMAWLDCLLEFGLFAIRPLTDQTKMIHLLAKRPVMTSTLMRQTKENENHDNLCPQKWLSYVFTVMVGVEVLCFSLIHP